MIESLQKQLQEKDQNDQTLIQQQRDMLSPEKISQMINNQMDAKPKMIDQMVETEHRALVSNLGT